MFFYVIVYAEQHMEKKIRLKDLAVNFGVSTATVSRALNDSYEISEALRKKIQAYAEQVGYHPDRTASTLRRGLSRTIGLIVPSVAYNFNVRLIAGLESVVIPRGYKVLIFQTMEDHDREVAAVEYLLSIGVDGVIASLAAGTHCYDHLEMVRKQAKPLVLVDRTCDEIDASQVVIDHVCGSYQAVRHLLETGCRKIAWITGPKELPLTAMRQKGYEKALAEFGVPFDRELICHCAFHTDWGFGATRDLLLRHPSVDGIYAINDRIAVGVMGAVHSLKKKIPEDIAVVGFNNEPINPLLNPPLSSVCQPAAEMGREAGQLLLDHLQAAAFRPEKRILDTQLIVRSSSDRQ